MTQQRSGRVRLVEKSPVLQLFLRRNCRHRVTGWHKATKAHWGVGKVLEVMVGKPRAGVPYRVWRGDGARRRAEKNTIMSGLVPVERR